MDKIALLENLERLAHKLRKLGLHPVTRLGRYSLHPVKGYNHSG
jgi:hypothetical protein